MSGPWRCFFRCFKPVLAYIFLQAPDLVLSTSAGPFLKNSSPSPKTGFHVIKNAGGSFYPPTLRPFLPPSYNPWGHNYPPVYKSYLFIPHKSIDFIKADTRLQNIHQRISPIFDSLLHKSFQAVPYRPKMPWRQTPRPKPAPIYGFSGIF